MDIIPNLFSLDQWILRCGGTIYDLNNLESRSSRSWTCRYDTMCVICVSHVRVGISHPRIMCYVIRWWRLHGSRFGKHELQWIIQNQECIYPERCTIEWRAMACPMCLILVVFSLSIYLYFMNPKEISCTLQGGLRSGWFPPAAPRTHARGGRSFIGKSEPTSSTVLPRGDQEISMIWVWLRREETKKTVHPAPYTLTPYTPVSYTHLTLPTIYSV